MNRRNWLRNAAGLLVAAPFVVKADLLMPVKPLALTAGIDPAGVTLERTRVGLRQARMIFSYTEGEVVHYLPLYVTSIETAWSQIERDLRSKADGDILTLGKGEFTLGEGFSLPKWYTANRQIAVVEPETWVRGEIPIPARLRKP